MDDLNLGAISQMHSRLNPQPGLRRQKPTSFLQTHLSSVRPEGNSRSGLEQFRAGASLGRAGHIPRRPAPATRPL